MYSVSTLLTLIAIVLMASFGAFGAFEWLGTLSFSAWAFRIGPKVLSEQIELPADAFAPDAHYDSSLGQLRAVPGGTLVFHSRGARTAGRDTYAVRGTVRLESGEAVVQGRLSLSAVGFFSGLYLFLLGLGWSALASGNVLTGLGAIVATVVGIGATVFAAIPIEVKRARQFLDEFKESA